jgi:uncharacterized protein (TIGR00255 family)
MTGFGLGRAQSNLSLIEVSLRTVNGRFLEVRFHLPRELVPFESDLKKTIEKHFSRGTIDVFVSRRVKPSAKSHEVLINTELATAYAEAYKKLAKSLKIPAALHLEAIARLPDVVKVEDTHQVSTTEKKELLKAFEQACKACDEERKREGKSLQKDLGDVLEKLEAEVAAIQSVREEVNRNLLERFEARIKAKLNAIEVDPARLSQEIALQLEKSDINEELSRLREHLRNYRELLKETVPQGKKMDFYTQELLREVNTIGSKSSVAVLTQSVVQAKTWIERLREQVQNVE